jgi:hypothetical protein
VEAVAEREPDVIVVKTPPEPPLTDFLPDLMAVDLIPIRGHRGLPQEPTPAYILQAQEAIMYNAQEAIMYKSKWSKDPAKHDYDLRNLRDTGMEYVAALRGTDKIPTHVEISTRSSARQRRFANER